jgi:hypothetical protein
MEVGTSRPIALAGVMFSTVSFFVGTSIGQSVGFSPFNMRST